MLSRLDKEKSSVNDGSLSIKINRSPKISSDANLSNFHRKSNKVFEGERTKCKDVELLLDSSIKKNSRL